jgi:dipeptidyl aminopeptidase/acylaminoacyl peptidase
VGGGNTRDMRRSIAFVLTAGLVALAGGCTEDRAPLGAGTPAVPPPTSVGGPAPTASSSVSRTPTAPPRPSRSTPTPSPTPSKRPDPISVRALIEKEYNGDRLNLGRVINQTDDYTTRIVTYRSEKLTVSGVMLVPDGDGPFPVLVLNHGYIDPDSYFPGQGMPREHDYLARQNYVVFHIDYRGHASGDDDPDVDYELRLPYVVDTINAVYAVKRSELDFLDGDRVGWLGRSMGGNVTLNALVAQPDLVDAAVIYASTSSLAAQNWKRFYQDSDDRRSVNRKIARTYGLPGDNRAFWRAASPKTYFDRVSDPLLVHHGTADDTCPIEWSEDIVETLEDKDKDVTFHRYRGAGHTFEGSTWQRSIERTAGFFDEHLD